MCFVFSVFSELGASAGGAGSVCDGGASAVFDGGVVSCSFDSACSLPGSAGMAVAA